ncbi:Holliday junction resolvase RuvX [Desulforudis sp. 1088]|uniref:Holliday junction resolvase RuvX n=1 Tax=unclassified Candidatus Desulforudis TaxID=2635950 RepID=UPI003CE56BBD
MRILGLDVGDKRIGVALSDELGLTAQGQGAIVRGKPADDIRRIAEIIASREVESVVVGLPKKLDGSIGPQAQKVLEFVEELRKAVKVPIILWDERLSTAQVEKILIDADVRRARRRKVVDAMAAAVILDSYLRCREKRPESLDVPPCSTLE